jgi:type II secretory pathway pseudopilin PulG
MSRQHGFTLIGALIAIGVMGAGLAAYGELTSHAAQREKERELLFVGNQFRQAIAAYYEGTPDAVKRFPQKLEDLLEDKRHATPQRYLRRIYADPMTGNRHWGVIAAPGGGVMGVYSLSVAQPIKSWGFAARDSVFAEATRYSDWGFTYSPPGAMEPAGVEKTSTKNEPSTG